VFSWDFCANITANALALPEGSDAPPKVAIDRADCLELALLEPVVRMPLQRSAAANRTCKYRLAVDGQQGSEKARRPLDGTSVMLPMQPEYHLDVMETSLKIWTDPSDDAIVLAVASGMKNADPNQIHTTELNYLGSVSLNDARWKRFVELDACIPTTGPYAQMLKSKNTIGRISERSSWDRQIISSKILTRMAAPFEPATPGILGNAFRCT
jgi:hypothetical protein